MITRRNFIKSLSFLSLVPVIGKSQSKLNQEFAQDSIRVLQSATLETSTLITVLAHRISELEISVQSFSSHHPAQVKIEKIDLKLGEYVIYQVHAYDLEVSARYRLDIFDKTHNRLTKRNFKSLDIHRKDNRIAVVTCSNHRNADPQRLMFDNLKNNRPDIILFPGDLVYANSALDTVLGRPATPEEAYAVYCKTFLELDFYSFEDLIPVFSSWDDHDMAFNNADSTHPNLEIMLKMFRTFYPVDNRVVGISPGPGVSFCFDAFGAQFLFLDVRYFFDKKKKFILGSEQLNWLINNIQESDKPQILVSALQFWNYGKLAECFEIDAEQEFKSLLKLLKELKNPVLFISGDVHYSQIQTVNKNILGYPTYEISSSAIFSLSSRAFGKRSIEKGQIHYYGYPNFLMLENFRCEPTEIHMSVRCVTEDSNSEFKTNLKILAES